VKRPWLFFAGGGCTVGGSGLSSGLAEVGASVV